MRLSSPTRICNLCFKNYSDNSLIYLFNNNLKYCKQCLNSIHAKFIKFDVDGIHALSLFDYDDKIQSLIYQFKGCFDYELRDVFLNRYYRELSILYHGYWIIPIPSFELDDEERGFNHVVEIFSFLKLPILNILRKTEKVKQATSGFKARKNISKFLELKKEIDLSSKKVLLVDDVYTTGSTMKAAINLVKKLHPKKIKVLVISKTKLE